MSALKQRDLRAVRKTCCPSLVRRSRHLTPSSWACPLDDDASRPDMRSGGR